MRIVIGPALTQSDLLKRQPGEAQTVVRILVGGLTLRIVAGGIVIAVLEKIHIVTKPGQTHHVLQVMPHQSP